MNFFLKLFLATVPFCGLVHSSRALELGDYLPNMGAFNQDNKKINLKELGKEKFTLIYFYPKADTPGCTAQACSLRDGMNDLQKNGIKVIGISADQIIFQKNFHSKYALPFDLLADDKGDLMRAFGVKRIPILGLAQRQSFLFHEGKLIWIDRQASTKTHAQDVLKVVNQFKSNPS